MSGVGGLKRFKEDSPPKALQWERGRGVLMERELFVERRVLLSRRSRSRKALLSASRDSDGFSFVRESRGRSVVDGEH